MEFWIAVCLVLVINFKFIKYFVHSEIFHHHVKFQIMQIPIEIN